MTPLTSLFTFVSVFIQNSASNTVPRLPPGRMVRFRVI
jgi:hypothetical protein